MQATNQPFNFKEVYNLRTLGLNPELFKFGSITFESSKYICVKDQAVSIAVDFGVSKIADCIEQYLPLLRADEDKFSVQHNHIFLLFALMHLAVNLLNLTLTNYFIFV